MGCCGSNQKLQMEIPLKKVDKYNKLILTIENFLSNENQNEKYDSNKILDLLIKTSNGISEYENELKKLKKIKNENKNISDELINEINKDIKILKNHHTTLNNLMKESEYIINKQNMFNNKEIILNNKNDIDNMIDIDKNENSLNIFEDINNKKEFIYFKKFIRRNKKGILNDNHNINKNKIAQLNYLSSYENTENDRKNTQLSTTENTILDTDNSRLNLIFELENGKKVIIHADKEEPFLNIIEKLGEKGISYNNISDLQFFDEDKDITEKIRKGEKVEDFGFTDFHLIQIKFGNKIN